MEVALPSRPARQDSDGGSAGYNFGGDRGRFQGNLSGLWLLLDVGRPWGLRRRFWRTWLGGGVVFVCLRRGRDEFGMEWSADGHGSVRVYMRAYAYAWVPRVKDREIRILWRCSMSLQGRWIWVSCNVSKEWPWIRPYSEIDVRFKSVLYVLWMRANFHSMRCIDGSLISSNPNLATSPKTLECFTVYSNIQVKEL